MNKNKVPFFALIVLLLVSLACNALSSGQDKVEITEPDTGSEQEPSVSEPEPEYAAGYEPGWRVFSNANFVNGLAVHDGILWAATEGGVVAWDLANDQAVKYTPLDGLGHLSAYDVVVCSMPDPRVVVATETGLSLYDPATNTWDTSLITPEDSHVATSKIDRLYCDQDNGRLLIGYSGIGILDTARGDWQRYTDSEGLVWNGIDAMTVVGTDVWAAGYKGISVISGQGVKVYNEANGMPEESTEAMVAGPDGSVWLGTGSGLVRFSAGTFKLFNRDNVEGIPAGTLYGLALASDGTVWMASSSNDLCQFDPAQESCVYTYDGNDDHFFRALTVGDNGDVYFGTKGGGIWAYDGSDWRNLFLREDQLVGNFVEAIAEDASGMLWVATDNGIQRFDPSDVEKTWETFKAGEGGPPSNWFQDIAVKPSGEVWFAHDSRRASSFDGKNWTRYGDETGITGSVNAIAFDKDGIPYIGTGEGLLVLGGASHTLLTDADGLPSKIVRSLYFDGDVMWVGTTDGLAKLEGMTVEVVLDASSAGLPDDNIGVIVKDVDGSLLLGTSEGLARFDGNQVTTLLEPDGENGLFSSNKSISSIAIGQDGSIWAGTYIGLYHFDGRDWERFSTADGLPANNINDVFVDSSGILWVGAGFTNSGGGLARYIPGKATSVKPEPSNASGNDAQGSGQDQPSNPSSDSGLKFDSNTSLPLFPDASQVYSTDTNLNYWSDADLASIREFYLTEMPNIGWVLDVDENGKCRDDDRCMGWTADYSDPSTQTFFFLKGEKGYLTMNLIPENGQINVLFLINEQP